MLVIASTAAVVLALTWGGVRFPWSSAHVLVPLLLGFVGLLAFMWYESRFAQIPLVCEMIYLVGIGVFTPFQDSYRGPEHCDRH